MQSPEESSVAEQLRVLIVAEHASARFGGEAALPLHYFRVLRQRKINVWLLAHARTRNELIEIFPGEQRILYVEDTFFDILMWRIGAWMPSRIAYATAGFASRVSTQLRQRRIIKKMVAGEGIRIVHQPIPVSPREPSMLFGLSVPVVIGPMNGGMDYPPAFRRNQGKIVTALLAAGRASADVMNRLIPGKLRAEVLIVANERTRRSLPKGVQGRVVELVENGVDLSLWAHHARAGERLDRPETRFLFMGRLIALKAVDALLLAFRDALIAAPMSLTIVGDGPERPRLEGVCRASDMLAASDGQPGKVFFAGWKSQAECAEFLSSASVLVLPSLMECGGAVVLEAMAASRPVIATDWGGPADYLDPSCGVLVKPTSRGDFPRQLAHAMVTLARSPDMRRSMGRAAHGKVVKLFDWEIKADRILEIYDEAVRGHSAAAERAAQPREGSA